MLSNSIKINNKNKLIYNYYRILICDNIQKLNHVWSCAIYANFYLPWSYLFELCQLLLFYLNVVEIFSIICRDMSHFHFLISTLNSSREAATLYSDGSSPQRDSTLYVIVLIPYFTVRLKSVESTWKCLILYFLLRNSRKEFIIGGATPLTIS